jgi:PAS domain S-box-containing protein
MTTLSESGVLLGEGILDRGPTPSLAASSDSLIDQNAHLDRLARTRLRLLDSLTEGIYQLDSDGCCVFMNRAACRMLGYRFGEAVGKNMQQLHYGQSAAAAARPIQPDVEQPLPKEPLEDIFRRTDGSRFPVECYSYPVYDNGIHLGTAITFRDITELATSRATLARQAEDLRRSLEALQHQTRLANSIITSMAEGVLATDQNGDIVVYNPAATSMVGDQPGTNTRDTEAIKDLGLVFLLPDQRTIYATDQLPLQRALRGETVDDDEMFVKTAQRPQGFWLSATARPLLDDSDVVRGGVVVFRDVTEQKSSREALRRAKEEAEQANHAKSEFLSRMSHELRTPLNAILGFGQLLEIDDLTPDQSDAIARILKAGRHLLGLINEVLDISRIEAGQLNLQMERLRPFEVMEAAIDLIGPLAAQRNIDLVPPRADSAHWCILADRQRLIQAFVNLLGNAVKYNREGGKVTVSLEEVAGRNLRIKVADTGFGLSPEQLKKLFIPFERLGAERSGIEGTGIGLAYSHRLVTAMGGSIGVESEVGKGSAFWVQSPLSEFEEAAKHVPLLRGDTAPGNDAGDEPERDMYLSTILYIQGDVARVLEIQEMIGRMPGYELISAERGSTGIQMALDHPPALVLLDLQLPDMDGMDVLKKLRDQMSAQQVPIVVVSADLTDAVKRTLLDAGAHDCIAKPIRRREFLDTILCLT